MADEDSYINKSIGNYYTVALIGSGGFGSVYQGVHSILQERAVAIKILHTFLSSPEERSRFLEEARLLEHIRHPHILQVFDVGIENGVPYLVTEYAPHGSLRDLLNQHANGILSEEVSLAILSQVGEALYHAHQQHVVHRDLKPENILFNANDMALLADFGIATTLSTSSIKYSTVIGTPSYMAPEQFQGTLSKEGDQYALGCIAYELFTGHVPFTAPDFFAMGFKHLTDKPVAPTQLNPELPIHIEQAILKAMAKKREDRHKDIRAFIAALYGTEKLPAWTASHHVPPSTNTLAQIAVNNPVSSSSPQLSDDSTFIPEHMEALNQQGAEQTLQPEREETLPAGQEPSSPFAPTLPRAAPSSPRASEPFLPTVPAPFTSPHKGIDSPDKWEPLRPFPADDERQWSEAEQIGSPIGGSWNREALDIQRRDTRRRRMIMTIVSACVAMIVVGSLLFVLLPNLFPAHSTTVRTLQSGTINGFTGTPGTTNTPGNKSQSRPTSTSSSTPIPTSAPNNGSTTISQTQVTATPVATTAPNATPIATTAPTPTPTRAPTASTVPTPTPTTAPTPTPSPTPSPTPTQHTETFRVYFSGANASGQEVTTQYAYSGTVSVIVSGYGQASGSEYSDAYYIYTDAYGTPATPHTATCWVLYINGQTADSYTGLPAYDSSHVYSLTMTLSQPTALNFGVCDGDPSDNTGYLTVTVQGQGQ